VQLRPLNDHFSSATALGLLTSNNSNLENGMLDIGAGTDIRELFDKAPMSRVQIKAIAVTIVLALLEGYDLLSVTFAAPVIADAWHVGKASLGILFASGLAGMAIGSLGLAPIADIVGRRNVAIGSLVLMSVGMLLSSYAQSLNALAVLRMITGLGIGTVIPVTNSLAAEYANLRWRSFSVSLVAMGTPLGGLIGGIVASVLLRSFTWSSVFLAGFGASVVLLPLVLAFLPEPVPFLLTRRRSKSLTRVNTFLRRCRQPELTELPPLEQKRQSAYAAIFAPDFIGTTVRITLVYVLFLMSFFYMISWLPQLITEEGFEPSTASIVAAAVNITAIPGGILLGRLSRPRNLSFYTVTSLIASGVAVAIFGFTPPSLPLILIVSMSFGLFTGACIAGLYSTFSAIFTVEARTTGVGFTVGVGRIASVFAPWFAGWLFSLGTGRQYVSLVFAACLVLGGAVLATVKSRKQSSTSPRNF
jgi:MFS transporter, AAHS family, 4-hydroxybenzoate transporter